MRFKGYVEPNETVLVSMKYPRDSYRWEVQKHGYYFDWSLVNRAGDKE